MGGSSSQRRTDPAMSSINAFPVEELYSPQFLDSFQENTGYCQEPNPHESTVKQVATSPKKTKKPTRARQKRTIESDDAPRLIAWTTKEEIALAKGWVAIYENNKHGNARKQDGFWCEVLQYIESKTNQYGHGPKWQEIAFSKFAIESSGGSKRHKSSGSTSFNTESEDASINLNTNVGENDEDEVQEIRRPGGRDKAKAAGKNKGSKALGSSTMNDDALASLMVTEMTTQEKEQREIFLEIKRRDVECREREVATQEYRQEQEDIRFYLRPYDHLTGDHRMTMDEVRAKIKAKYNLQY
ncbi:hypothetical protein Tco_1377312 [Tanacetum coccineum]